MSESVKYAFLVAGNEYHYHFGFLRCCTERVYELVRKIDRTKKDNPYGLTFPTRVVFIRYEIGAGKVSTFEKTITSEPTRPFSVEWTLLSRYNIAKEGYTTSFKELLGTDVSIGPFRALVFKDDYTSNSDSEGTHNSLKLTTDAEIKMIMSAASVYAGVRSAPVGSVLELSIFSHAMTDGPILVNTYDLRSAGLGPTIRSPKDVDCRALYDFATNMGEDTTEDLLSRFIKAFQTATDAGGKTSIVGEIHIWGCMQSSAANETIRLVSKKGSSITDATRTQIMQVQLDADGHVVKKNGRVQFKTIYWVPFSELKARIARVLRLSKDSKTGATSVRYIYYCARRTGIPTWGAGVGDSANIKNTKLMKTEYGYISAFYGKHLGITIDEWGYGRIDADQVKKIDALAGAPFPSVP